MKNCILLNSLLLLLTFQSQSLHAQSYVMQYDPSGNLQKKSIAGQGPNLQIAGAETLCPGDTLVWTASGGQSYQWSTGAQGATLKVVPPASGQYSVTTTAANGCTAVRTRTFTVFPQPNLGFIQQTSPVGAPGPVSYAVSAIPAAAYFWSAVNGFILSGQGTPTVQVQWSGSGQEELKVYAVSQQGCSSDTISYQPAAEDEQFIPLNTGWNLVSTYLAPFDYSTPAVFSELEQSGVLVRVKTIDKIYTPGVPIGNSLQALEDGAGYWVKVTQPATWEVTGVKIDPISTPIALKQGWNLIGYLPNHPIPVQQALASILPNIQKVKTIYNSFDPAAPPIFNTLQQMEPGQGYLIRMTAPGTLVYPPDNFTGIVVASRTDNPLRAWQQQVVAYPNSVAAYGLVTLNGHPVPEGRIILAKVAGELRAVGTTVLHEGQSYVTLVINGDQSEQIQFYLLEEDEQLTSSFQLVLTPGTDAETVLPLAFGATTSISATVEGISNASVYPNPTAGLCTLRLETTQPTEVRVCVTDLLGRSRIVLPSTSIMLPGSHSFLLDLRPLSLPAGMYPLEVYTTGGVIKYKVFIQQP